MDTINVLVTNNGSFDHNYDFRDGVSGRKWQQAIRAGQSWTFSLASNHALDDGYGDLFWHQDESGAWNEHSQLRHGESVAL